MFNLTYEFKLKPNQEQTKKFDFWLEQCRRIYNYALAERKDWIKSRSCLINACSLQSEYIIPADTPKPSFYSQSANLTKARSNIPDLKAVSSKIEHQTLKRLDKAFIGMWKQGKGFPRFKKKGSMRSFVFSSPKKITVKGKHLDLPVIGLVKFIQSRDIPSDALIKQITIVRKASGYYALLILAWDINIPVASPKEEAVGVDVGLTSFIATSDGLCVKRPKFFVDLQRKLKLLQQKVSKKQLGSNNRRKAQAKVSKLHEHIANKRKNYHWKIANQLCNQAKTIFVEDLNLVGLCRAMLGKHCLDAGWGQFFQILEQCCFKKGIYFQKVDARKTSQTCPKCGVVTGKKELSERVHHCSDCGYKTDRDVAAAQVVLQRGLTALGYRVKKLAEGKFIGIPKTQEPSI